MKKSMYGVTVEIFFGARKGLLDLVEFQEADYKSVLSVIRLYKCRTAKIVVCRGAIH